MPDKNNLDPRNVLKNVNMVDRDAIIVPNIVNFDFKRIVPKIAF